MAVTEGAEFDGRRILVTGASGLAGSALVRDLESRGCRVVRLVRDRDRAGGGAVFWDPDNGALEGGRLEGIDAAVHLAGENVASGRWTAAKKTRIRESRVRGTDLLARTLASLERRPGVLVSASGVNVYGDRGDAELTEEEPPGKGFLAEVCRAWEDAAAPAREAGIRVVCLRIGPVLSREGGMLKKVLPAFRAGAGGRLGSGTQYLSWLALGDLVGIIEFCLAREDLRGPVNAVAPNPVTNAEFARVLGRVLRRPALLPAPASGLRLILGEMADEMLLASVRAVPRRLREAGYAFRFSELEPALRHAVGADAER